MAARSFAGMDFKQDMPPPGGYQEILWQRTFPRTWVNERYLQIEEEHRRFQDVYTRRTSTPEQVVEAAKRIIWLKLLRKNRDLEDEVMKDVPGWKTGTWYGEPVYFTLGDQWYDLWRTELFAHSPERRYQRDLWYAEHPEYCAPKWYDKYTPKFLLERIY